MSVHLLSDLHIRSENDPIYHATLEILRTRVHSGDIVVLAGDIFDLLIGGKIAMAEPYTDFFATLKEFGRKNVRVEYIEGNHDFLLSRLFRDSPHVRISLNAVEFDRNGKKFHIVHGDTIDRCDFGYLALRTFFRSPIMKTIVRVTPGQWLKRFGEWSSRLSQTKNPRLLEDAAPHRRETLRRTYRNYAAQKITEGFDFVVAGHCHDRDEMKFHVNGREGHYMNIGYPRVHRSYVFWNETSPTLERVELPRLAFDRL